ncbi:OmpA family protein [Rhodoferax sp. GW822-FHT02A01]|uniref:OmpA family protein n=1 Tax=Rhodoferax sp. GW822-FHT02A01 TaxID=3141537 RepID=UPI00315DDCDA
MFVSPIPLHSKSILQVAMLLLLPIAALAQGTVKEGYLLDRDGNFVYSATPGQCWHTGEWTPALAQEPCDPVAKAAVPAPVVVAAAPMAEPEPAPVPKAIVVATPVQMMRFSADTLFAFDKATITPKGKAVLDDASAKILSINGEKVRVVGHADRIGTTAYNQKLSESRAYAVRDYLVFKGVPATGMEAIGVGETDPVTKPEDCVGRRSAKIIACLQPDRRVDVEVQGSKAAATP